MDGYYAWMIVATALVLMMTTPALALFYGGMTRSKSVLNMMMMSYVAMAVVGIVYVLWGWSESFGAEEPAGGLFADPFALFGLKDVEWGSYIAVCFQLTFAVITAALISGAIADRVKLSSWVVFLPLWVTLCYFPLAHMVWGGGWISDAPRGAGLRGRHGRPHQRRCRRRRARADHRPPRSASAGPDAAAQPDPDHDRRRPAVVRLVRLQRRLDRLHRRRPRPRRHRQFMTETGVTFLNTTVATMAAMLGLAARSSGCCTARPPRSARPRASSPGWSRSRRPAARSNVVGAIAIGAVAGVACALRRRPEVQARPRRLARRRRRPPRRRRRRHRADRLPVHLGSARRHRRTVLRRRAHLARSPGVGAR